MTFKVGQVWMDRSGRNHKIASINDGVVEGRKLEYPIFSEDGNAWTMQGLCIRDASYSLISLVSDPAPARLTLEVGKPYVTADGTPVKIVSRDDDDNWPFDGSNGDCYGPAGNIGLLGDDAEPGDLIAELQAPQAVPVGPEAAASAEPAEDRGFFLDQLMFEIIRANPGAASQWLCGTFLALAYARNQT